ncbi:MAG: DoxX family protein [Pseudonocardiaceae bacterium]
MTTTHTPDVGNRTAPVSVARDLVLLLARIGLGVLMVAHAKLEYDFAGGSIAGVGALFEEAGVPLAAITGPANVLFEFVGGAAMILGLAVLPVGVLMALNMVGAWIFVHTGGLLALDHTGPELVITLGLLSLVLAVSGSGRLGLDHLIIRRVRRRASTA